MTREIGKANYETYREMVGGVTWNGDNMKEFEEIPERLQNAWEFAGLNCIRKFLGNRNNI